MKAAPSSLISFTIYKGWLQSVCARYLDLVQRENLHIVAVRQPKQLSIRALPKVPPTVLRSKSRKQLLQWNWGLWWFSDGPSLMVYCRKLVIKDELNESPWLWISPWLIASIAIQNFCCCEFRGRLLNELTPRLLIFLKSYFFEKSSKNVQFSTILNVFNKKWCNIRNLKIKLVHMKLLYKRQFPCSSACPYVYF